MIIKLGIVLIISLIWAAFERVSLMYAVIEDNKEHFIERAKLKGVSLNELAQDLMMDAMSITKGNKAIHTAWVIAEFRELGEIIVTAGGEKDE